MVLCEPQDPAHGISYSAFQVVVDPADYSTLLDALKSGKDDLDFRKRLAWKAYQHTATYDSTVAEWMWSQIGTPYGFMSLLLLTA